MSSRGLFTVILAGLMIAGCDPAASDIAQERPGVVGAPAAGLSVDHIDLFQGVAVPIMEGGEAVGFETVPVVANRPAMLRVFVDPASGFIERDVTGVLTVVSGGETHYMEITKTVERRSTNNNINSTLNFDIPAELMTSDVTIHVALQEIDFAQLYDGSVVDSQWPINDAHDLDPTRSAGIEVVVIPIQYSADGSNREPDTSPAQMEIFRQQLMAMYPATEVTITVSETAGWSGALNPDGSGWSQLLQAIAGARQEDNVPANTYYYGLFSPASSIGQFCNQGCVLGLSLVGGETDVWSRASMGLGFTGISAANTLVHEVGHAHGRRHAPCQLGGQEYDTSYPYSGGSIGVWGYDMYSGALKNPDDYADMMGYCDPHWISDYTYNAVLDRINSLAVQGRYRADPNFDRNWQSMSINADGTLSIGVPFELDRAPSGEPTTVDVLDVDGNVVDSITGHFAEFNHIDGGILLMPSADVSMGVMRVRID